MATRRKSSSRSNGSSPFGYIIFGIVAGLGIAAAAAYYLRANSQKSAHTTSVVTQQQKLTPIQRPAPAPVVTSPPASQAPLAKEQATTTMESQPDRVVGIASPSIAQQAAQMTDTSPATTAMGTSASESKPTIKDHPKQTTSTTEVKSSDQIGNLIHTINIPKKTDAKVSSTTSTTSEKTPSHYLQVGSFKNSAEAEAKRAQLLMQGFSNITITKATVNNTEFNRVRIGPFFSDASLKEAQERLKSKNINATVIR